MANYDGFTGISDIKGNTLIPYKYDYIYYKTNGKHSVVLITRGGSWGSGSRYGLYNSKNEKVLECEYDFIEPDTSDYVVVTTQNSVYSKKRSALIEAETGKIVLPFDYLDMSGYSEGLIGVENLQGKWGYVDIKGNVVIPFIYKGADKFSEGLACVKKHSGYGETILGKREILNCGYIDHKGNVVIPFKYRKPLYIINSEFHEGLAVQGVNEKDMLSATNFGYIDKQGEWVIRPSYSKAEPFEHGLARVVWSDYAGFVDKKGVSIIPCKYDQYSGRFLNDSIIVMQEKNRDCFFNLQGQKIDISQIDLPESYITTSKR